MTSVAQLLITTILASIARQGTTITCDPDRGEVMIRSESTGMENQMTKSKSSYGQFNSPNWPARYTPETRCVFRFVAGPGEKVRIQFDYFRLLGEMPSCPDDFLDVYIDVASSSLDNDRQNALLTHLASGEPLTTTPFSAAVYSSVLDRSALLGRYCGSYLNKSPIEFISLHREIVIDFFANYDSKPASIWSSETRNAVLGFNGSYEFINDGAFYPGRALSPAELRLSTFSQTTSPCRFRIEATGSQHDPQTLEVDQLPGSSGILLSPTYPGYHPDGLLCVYQLVGLVTQRINIDVLDLDLPGQPGLCPTDYLLFYDGLSMDTSPVINSRFCGQNRRIRVVSTGANLLVLFATATSAGEHATQSAAYTMDTQRSARRGFRLRYTFTDLLLPVNTFEYKNWHIRGTECDYIIRSTGPSSATFESPTYKSDRLLLPNRACSFYFLGSNHAADRIESVRIFFESLHLPGPHVGSDQCDNGFLAIYGSRDLSGVYQLTEPSTGSMFELSDEYTQATYIWCDRVDTANLLRADENSEQTPIVARSSLLLLRLNSSGVDQPGMKASFRLRYRFERSFGIPGLALQHDACQFVYSPTGFPFLNTESPGGHSSVEHTKGWTNSPFYPNSFPSNTTCIYLFIVDRVSYPNQSIRLSFGSFEIQNQDDTRSADVNVFDSTEDCSINSLEVVSVRARVTHNFVKNLVTKPLVTSSLSFSQHNWFHKWKMFEQETKQVDDLQNVSIRPELIYCGNRIPGPIVSTADVGAILLRFNSRHNLQARGFSLLYEFVSTDQTRAATASLSRSCGGNVNSADQGGLIETPNYPYAYPARTECVWHLMGLSKGSTLALHFEKFFLEGTERDCSRAVVRIYEDGISIPLSEYCGNLTSLPPLIVSRTAVTIQFVTTENPSGANGFRLVWTELLVAGLDGSCDGFSCKHTKHCIARGLLCDGLPHCGVYEEAGKLITDTSDEGNSCFKTVTYNILHISIGVIITFVLLFGLIILVYVRERSRHKTILADPLAELTGSKHSLATAQPGTKLHGQFPKHSKSNLNTHPYMHSHQNSRTHLHVDGELIGAISPTGTMSSMHSKKHHQQHHVHHDKRNMSTLTRSSHSHLGHECTNRKQPVHNQDSTRTHQLQCNSSNLQRRIPRKISSHMSTISRGDGTMTDSVSNAGGSTGMCGMSLSADSDGGLLTRERMQKISIV
ncbi:hypothetical protein EG68_00399 [Paragonimus skrjabini miyazakii]|uniref:CUB domain-containing protein n=1 Tax=Paragonimus skrjabini miyazakii TaxID=59628 RepID=A0A8S9Z9T4_9TREM|nr:hypothetical protein EG68_00399 [Paragonimus skrjabini miyazakii]